MPNAGDIVNTTEGIVNANTGAATTTGDMSPGMKVYWDTSMLENMRPKLVFGQFGRKHALPASHGKLIEWRKWKTFAEVGRLQEGVIPTGKKFGQTATSATIAQYGDYVTISDQLDMHHVDPVIAGAQVELAAAAANTMDMLHRDAILAGATNVMYADAVDKTDGYKRVGTPLSAYALTADENAACLLTPDMIAQARAVLESNNVPKIDDRYYVCVVHPYTAYDLMRNPEWNDFHKYEATEQIFAGEIGEMYGIRFVQTTNAPVLVGEPLFGEQRYLTLAESGFTTLGMAPEMPDGVGASSLYQFTVSEDLESASTDWEALLGQYVLLSAKGSITDRLIVTGVDKSGKHIYTKTAPTGSASAGDYLLPGNGGAESVDGKQVAVFASILFGADAYGIVDPAGGALSMIIKNRGEIGGPLEQFSTVGVKFETGAKILYPERCLVIYHTGKYSDSAVGNWRL